MRRFYAGTAAIVLYVVVCCMLIGVGYYWGTIQTREDVHNWAVDQGLAERSLTEDGDIRYTWTTAPQQPQPLPVWLRAQDSKPSEEPG